MGIRAWLFGSENDSTKRPPKPGPEQKSRTYEQTRYEAVIEYRNGDIKRMECYGIYRRGDSYITFNTDPHGYGWYDNASHKFDKEKIHYETLSREPILEEMAVDEFTLIWTQEYEWKRPRHSTYNADREWVPRAVDVELTVERGD